MASGDEITQLLAQWKRGDQNALADLLPLVYDELRALARSYLRRERRDHTLQATALVHDLYIRLALQQPADLQDRAHFFGVAARLMRQLLVAHARRHDAIKRGGGLEKIPLEEIPVLPVDPGLDLAALDEALRRLAAIDPEQARIVELLFLEVIRSRRRL